MSLKISEAALDHGLIHEPRQVPVSCDRQERKVKAARLTRTRRLKQTIMGAGFVVLLAAGWVYPLLGYFIPGCMVAAMGLAAFRGRSWCNWLCPRGSFEDAWVARISRGRRIPEVCRRTPLRLAVLTFLMVILVWQIIRLWPDAWAIGGSFVLLLTVTTVVGVVLGVMFQQRTWCYLCPIGTLSRWAGENRRPLSLAPEKCGQCQLCAQKCPMQLTPADLCTREILPNRGDCLKCNICVASCPKGALAFTRPGTEDAAA